MENVDTNETITEVSTVEITSEEKGTERLTSASDDFLKNERHVMGENTSHNLVQPSTLESESVSNYSNLNNSTLIKEESTSSSVNVDESDRFLTSTSKENIRQNEYHDTVNLEGRDNPVKIENSKVTAINKSEVNGIDTTSIEKDGEKTSERMEDTNDNRGEPNSGESSSEANKEPEEEWMDILGSGHLMKKVLTPGTPNSRPQKSDICVLNIVGRLEDGTVVEQHEHLEINHSDNEVIQGLDFALALMDKGEVAEIKITPRFGYGSLGKRPEIPPGANLIYTVTLIDVKEEPPIHELNVMDRIKNGLKKKERGNWWYSRDENTLAINCYRRALDYLDDTDIPEPHSEEDVRKLLEERLKTYNNLGAAQMKVSAFDAALMSVNNVLTAQPENVKALFRKAKILKEKGELLESINVIKLALSHEPESQTLQQELSSLMAAQRRVNSKQRELYKKMMGNSNNQPDEESKKKNSKNNYKTFTMVAAVSFAVAVLGTIVVKYKF